MAKNDKVLIDGIIDERIEKKIPSDERDEAFEYFTFEQILKDYDLSHDEMLTGSVDGRNDGGIDGLFIFINGHLLIDPETFPFPKSGCTIEIFVITCKHHDTFRQAPLDSLVASLTELFDFSLTNSQLKGDYSEQILRIRENLKLSYRIVSPRLTSFSINFFYASRGVTTEIGESIISRANQITQISKDAFGNCDSSFSFLGSTELIELHRKAPNFSLDLPYVKNLSSGGNLILLVKLIDYYNFIQDQGKLRRYLFDSNVRDFMGLNRVNEDIRDSLIDENSPDFWWLNNGVTILATGAISIGDVAKIQDIQIVNGLQTSESIFRYFENGGKDQKGRSVLVKVIVSKDSNIRDSIIRATNNQTTVEISSLHATDKIQRDIEDVLNRHDIFYERRTNFYKNQGVSQERIVTPLYMASGYLNLVLKHPDQASKLKSKFMRSETSYNKIFSTSVDLNIWVQIANILRKTDSFLESVRPKKSTSENFLKSRRQILSFLTVASIFKSYNFTAQDLIKLDIEQYSFEQLEKVWEVIKSGFSAASNAKIKNSIFLNLCRKVTVALDIADLQRITKSKETLPEIEQDKRQANPKRITMELALKVNELLPPQPWKPGGHIEICKTLNITIPEYFELVKLLIEEGHRHNQKDGVVYDEDGNVITFDPERVDATTMSLRE